MYKQAVVMFVLFFTVYSGLVLADTYSWTDSGGVMHFTDDPAAVPKMNRKKVKVRSDADKPVADSQNADDAAKQNGGSPENKDESEVTTKPTAAENKGTVDYAWKKPEDWQAELKQKELKVKQLEQRLVELENAGKKVAEMTVKQNQELRAQFFETQKAYNDAVKNYNDLIVEVNKAGVPVELRK